MPEPTDPKEVARQALEALPPEQARAIALRFLQGTPARHPRTDAELEGAVTAACAKAGKPGLSRAKLLRSFRDCSADRLDKVLLAVVGDGLINSVSGSSTGGRRSIRFVWCGA